MPIVVNNMRAGEISARVDRLKSAEIVANGLLKAQNVTISPQGGVRKRPSLRRITTLPTGRNWARLFAWDKSEAERLTLCYADNGEFRVMLQGDNTDDSGVLVDVEGRGNIDTQDVMQFYNQGNRVIFTDGSAPRHIIASPVNVGDRVILLTNETQAGALLRNFAVSPGDPMETYTPPADQPIELADAHFSNTGKSTFLTVGELRSVFTPAAQSSGATSNFGVFAASGFTNNPQTYKNPTTSITINQVWVQRSGGGNQNKMRVALSTFPAWLENVVVRWGSTGQYSRTFTANNQFADVALTTAEKESWERGTGLYSVELVRRTADFTRRNNIQVRKQARAGDTHFAEFARWGDGDGSTRTARFFTSQFTPSINNTLLFGTPASGTFPTQMGGIWRLRKEGDTAQVQGALTVITQPGSTFLRVGTPEQMGVFAGTQGTGDWVLELQGFADTTGIINAALDGGIAITEVYLHSNESVLRLSQTGLTSAYRIVIEAGFPTQAIEFTPGATTLTLNAAQLAAFRSDRAISIRAESQHIGLEANEADFYAMAVEGNRPVYIRGRDYFALNAAKGLTRLPLLDSRRVSALVVDDRFQNFPEVILQNFRERVLPLAVAGGMSFSGDNIKTLLTVSDFIAFRPPVLNPPTYYFDDATEYMREQERIGKQFCIKTDDISGGSLTAGEYELEWVAQAPLDEDDNELTPVGTNGNARPDLNRRGITETFEDRSTTPPTIRAVTGWKRSNNTIVDIPDPLPSGATIYDYPNSPVAKRGTLVARRIGDNSANIGKPPGRYAMVWNDTDGFPRTVAQPQSRLAYGSNRTFPARVWMSVIGQPGNFLDARPQADDNTQPDTPRPDFSLILELDTSTIQQMVNDAALLVFTQNEAHIATGPFQANNPAAAHARRFGRLGQEFNVGAAVIDENVFVYSNGAPFGLLYDGIDIGYISQNLSAQRNEDIMRNYRDAVLITGAEGVDRRMVPLHPLCDLSAISSADEAATNEGLRPVRIVATQPKGLNGAYLVLYLMSDGTIRAFHSLHREGFFAWSRWNFFEAENGVGTASEKIGDDPVTGRRKIIDISAEGSIVNLLDNRGHVYRLDGDQTADFVDGAEVAISVNLELPTFALPDPRFPGEALINPKQVEYAMFHFNDLSGATMVTAYGNDTDQYAMELKPQFPGDYNPLLPEGSAERTVFRGQRKVELSNFYTGDIDTDKKNTLEITNSGTEAWELLRVETEVQIDSTESALAFAGATARIRSGV